MNTPPSPRPRLVCRVVRRWCSLAPDSRPYHVTGCADCRAFLAAGDELDAVLRRNAGRWGETAPAADNALERRILQAVRTSAPAPAAEASPPWRGAWAVAAALAVVLGAGIFNRDPGPADDATVAGAQVLTDAVESVSRDFVDTVIPSVGALVADNPLQREWDSIYGDARSVIGFLALNFLPAAPAGAPAPPVRRS